MFNGFTEDTIRFFLGIRLHNEASWYNQHASEYEQFVKKPFYEFIDAVAPTALKIAPDMETRPAKCLSRIHRDTRFTKDKSPYRDHLWLLFRRFGEPRENCVMYWFELSPETAAWGVGMWGDNRPAMNVLRKRMEDKPERVTRALKLSGLPDAELPIRGESYKRMRVPSALPPPLDAIYPMKSIYIMRKVPLIRAYDAGIADDMASDMLRLKPMYELLRSVADEAIAAMDA